MFAITEEMREPKRAAPDVFVKVIVGKICDR